jgi:hypothetical protein
MPSRVNRSFSLSFCALPLLALVAPACAVFGSDAAPTPTESAPEPARGEAQDAPVAGTPAESELDEGHGVFVKQGGRPDAKGTRVDPLGSIGLALELARSTRRRVFICEGKYEEGLVLMPGDDITSGLSCAGDTWRTGGGRAILRAPKSPAIVARRLTQATRIQGLEVTAPPGTSDAPSSIVLLADNAPSLLIASSVFRASRGADGRNGETPEAAVLQGGQGADGNPEMSPSLFGAGYVAQFAANPQPSSGGAAGVGTCSAGPQPGRGGRGHGGQAYKATLTPGLQTAWYPFGPAPLGREVVFPTTGARGVDGASATSRGRLTREGFARENGTIGTSGGAGTGGWGGIVSSEPAASVAANTYMWVASGGGGGSGGCAGLAGTPGTGGGASIAALLFDSSPLTFEDVELISDAGGAGGAGSFGSEPTLGGLAGATQNATQAARNGAPGGAAGVSGSGAGGPSFALAHEGPAPKMKGTKLAHGPGGAGIPEQTRERVDGSVQVLPASPTGAAEDEYGF